MIGNNKTPRTTASLNMHGKCSVDGMPINPFLTLKMHNILLSSHDLYQIYTQCRCSVILSYGFLSRIWPHLRRYFTGCVSIVWLFANVGETGLTPQQHITKRELRQYVQYAIFLLMVQQFYDHHLNNVAYLLTTYSYIFWKIHHCLALYFSINPHQRWLFVGKYYGLLLLMWCVIPHSLVVYLKGHTSCVPGIVCTWLLNIFCTVYTVKFHGCLTS